MIVQIFVENFMYQLLFVFSSLNHMTSSVSQIWISIFFSNLVKFYLNIIIIGIHFLNYVPK